MYPNIIKLNPIVFPNIGKPSPQKKTKHHLTGTSTIHPPYIRTISHCKHHGGSNSSPPCAPLSPAAAKTMRHLADKAPGFCPGEKRCAVDFFKENQQETMGTPYNWWWTYVRTNIFFWRFSLEPTRWKGFLGLSSQQEWVEKYIFGRKKYVFFYFWPTKIVREWWAAKKTDLTRTSSGYYPPGIFWLAGKLQCSVRKHRIPIFLRQTKGVKRVKQILGWHW